jgi:hypothetical protein
MVCSGLALADTTSRKEYGAVAQLGERLLCKQDVVGSIPSGSTILALRAVALEALVAGSSAWKNGLRHRPMRLMRPVLLTL